MRTDRARIIGRCSPPTPSSAAATWRPQLFGDKRAATIEDPIVEPLWTGPRVLAFVDRGSVRLTDADGDAVEGHDGHRRGAR